MTEKKKMQVVFDPGAFDNFDGTQDELDEMVAEIQRMAESGELMEHSMEITQDTWDLLPEEDKARILAAMEDPDAAPRNLQ